MEKIIVTESSSNIKLLARRALEGNWKKAILAAIIYMACVMIPGVIIEAIFGGFSPENLYSDEISDGLAIGYCVEMLYALLVSGAFTYGITLYFMQLIRYRKSGYGNVFSGFSHYGKAFGLAFMVGLFTGLWTMLFIVPGIIASLRYSQAFYILIDDPSKGIMQCIRESKEMMKGNKGKIFCLQLSFIPWMLLVMLVFSGILTMYMTISLMFYLPAALDSIFIVVSLIVMLAGMCIVQAYMLGSMVIFYDMAAGNLRAANSVPPTERESYDPWQS